MSAIPHSRATLPLAAACACWITSLPAASSVVTIDVVDDDTQTWERMAEAVRTLRRGTPEEKLAVAGSAVELFADLGDDSDDDSGGPETKRIVESLRAVVREEKDDWITSLLLQGLIEVESEALIPLFRDALKSSSPNLRRRAILWLGEVEDPDALPLLERAWATEARSWIRKEMIEALVYQESPECIDHLFELAREDDPDLALTAAKSLGDLRDSRVPPLLATLSRDGPLLIRLAAIHGLAGSDDAEALGAILEVSLDPDPRLAEPAIQMLADRDEPAAEVRLTEAALSDDGLRESTLLALAKRNHPLLLPLVNRLLARAETLPSGVLEAAEGLRRGGGPRLRPGVDGIYARLDPPVLRRVTPPPGERSASCWKAPGLARDSEVSREILEDAEVRVLDVFESEGETWLKIPDEGGTPEDTLSKGPDDSEEDGDLAPDPISTDGDPFRRELLNYVHPDTIEEIRFITTRCSFGRVVAPESGCWLPESVLAPPSEE